MVDTSEEGLIRGAGPISLGFPQRGLGETGKSPITTVKHRRVLWCDLYCLTIAFTFIVYECLIYIVLDCNSIIELLTSQLLNFLYSIDLLLVHLGEPS